MGVPLEKVYDAFLTKMLEDEWLNWTQEEIEQDFRSILASAIVYFKFPRHSLKIDEDSNSFSDNLDDREIEILATYMKVEWLNRTILTWENVKPLYVERDFSQANLIDKLKALLEGEEKKAYRLQSIYYRSIEDKPFKYRTLAGDEYV